MRTEEILHWPEYGISDFYGFFLVVGLLILVFIITRIYYSRKLKNESHWYVIHSYAVRKGFTSAEMSELRIFYTSLSPEDSTRLASSRRFFHRKLAEFFRDQDVATSHSFSKNEMRVRIVDKLFPQMEYHLEVNSVNDLQPGEICAVEFGEEHHLGHIMRHRENRILIAIAEWKADGNADPIGSEAKMYVYRNGTGGFLLSGTIHALGKDGVVFEQHNSIERTGEKHLMALMALPIILRSWPLPEESMDLQSDQKKERLIFQGHSDKISDRGLSFDIQSQESSEFRGSLSHGQDLWEIEFTLPDGFVFRCRGRILPMPAQHEKYLFKYLDLTENSRRVLYYAIKDHGGRRERLI